MASRYHYVTPLPMERVPLRYAAPNKNGCRDVILWRPYRIKKCGQMAAFFLLFPFYDEIDDREFLAVQTVIVFAEIPIEIGDVLVADLGGSQHLG